MPQPFLPSDAQLAQIAEGVQGRLRSLLQRNLVTGDASLEETLVRWFFDSADELRGPLEETMQWVGWHHQVHVHGQAVAYARSVPDHGGVRLVGLYRSALPRWVDTGLESLGPGPGILPALVVSTGYDVYALWPHGQPPRFHFLREPRVDGLRNNTGAVMEVAALRPLVAGAAKIVGVDVNGKFRGGP